MQPCQENPAEPGLLIEFTKNSTALEMERSNTEDMKDDLVRLRERVATLEGQANSKSEKNPWAIGILSVLLVGCLALLGWDGKSGL